MLYVLRQPSCITHSNFPANWSTWTSPRKPLYIARVSGAHFFSRFSALKSDENKLSQVSNTNLIQRVRTTIRRLLVGCNVQYKVVPFDHALYHECFDVAVKRGYPMSSSEPCSVLPFLPIGVTYGANPGGHITPLPNQIWIALCTACLFFVEDIPRHLPTELPSIRTFNDRLVRGEKQGNAVLDAVAGLLKETPRIFGGHMPANLLTTSILDFVTTTVMEYETTNMQISASAKGYPSYQRVMSGIGEAYAIMAFPPDIPYEEYIQAMPELALFICTVNDVLSFYKEELDGESNTHVATMAARKGISKVEAFEELTDTSVELYQGILSILEGSPRSASGLTKGMDNREREGGTQATPSFSRASKAFKQFAAGYFAFHFSSERYRLMEVGL
ncbi:hypothetical protein PAXINDRAFT_101514 [Paxillus involutus ATCC 200175]|uniref:Terpene synthase n=1 Tax=Paxillus involutus ATCC 200175 TaxID=664439 RepID=A0A0C9ST54_PAXIN|nr:hypothetical protein PAXINDRAFT_101514 [Paxillus involutus ATCC 200175]